jgi:LacI family transcriptional regulator
MPEKLSSIDIARLAGVSQATVSRVLTGGASVKPETRARVLRVVRESGYQPSSSARAMRTSKSGIVGVAVSRVTNPVVPEILEALAARFSELGRRTVVWNTDIEGASGVIEAMLQGAVDGLVFTAASHQSDAFGAALERDFPIISLNRMVEGARCDQIVSTNREGACRLADYLYWNGRRSFAFVNGPKDRSTLSEREAGFVEQLQRLGVEIPPERRIELPIFDDRIAVAAMQLVAGPTPPDAIACGNDVVAIGVLNGLKRSGVRVPEDVWVTGFDGIEMSGWDIVDLTTMRQPVEAMAADAADALVQRIDSGFSEPRVIQYRTELVIRGSTAHAQEQTSKRSEKGGTHD